MLFYYSVALYYGANIFFLAGGVEKNDKKVKNYKTEKLNKKIKNAPSILFYF
jgi:hypothetical protein